MISLFSVFSWSEQNQGAQYSKDCKMWIPTTTSNEKIENGYIKIGKQLVYFDSKKQLWIQLGNSGPMFHKHDGYMNILMGPYLISHPMSFKSGDVIANVIMSMAESAKEMSRKDSRQWRVRSQNGRGEITYFLSPSEKCSHAPNARFISCQNNKCMTGPQVPNSENVSKLCIKELKLMSSEKTLNLAKACKVFSDEKIYKLLSEESRESSRACGSSDLKLMPYAETKTVCNDALGWIKVLQ